MNNGQTTHNQVTIGYFRYTLGFAFSAKFLFCLINATTIMFIYHAMTVDTTVDTKLFKNPFIKNQDTIPVLVGVFTYILLPIANTLNTIKFINVMKCNSKFDITALWFLAIFWLIYQTIMVLIALDYNFGKALEISFPYTLINTFVGLSGLPLYDYFFLWDTNSDRIL